MTFDPILKTKPTPTESDVMQQAKGILFVLIGPAGVGKNAVMEPVKHNFPQLRQLPTATTRSPRPGEEEGREHFFVSRERFEEMIANGELVEHQEVHKGKFYGTPRLQTQQALDTQQTLIADIDVHGALALKAAFPGRVCTIFIKPPSLEALAERLRKRGNMSEEEIQGRLDRAPDELRYADRFDHQVINDTFEQCVREVSAIIQHGLGND